MRRRQPYQFVGNFGNGDVERTSNSSDGYEQIWRKFFDACGCDSQTPYKPFLTVDTSLAALELVSCGVGHTIVLGAFAEHYFSTGRAKQAVDLELPHDESHFLAFPDNGKVTPPKDTAFRDWLMDEAAARRK